MQRINTISMTIMKALEVKCTTQTDRKHQFKHDQLVSNLNDHYVASIMLSKIQVKGFSVVDLYEDIKKECKLDNLNNKLKRKFFLRLLAKHLLKN